MFNYFCKSVDYFWKKKTIVQFYILVHVLYINILILLL